MNERRRESAQECVKTGEWIIVAAGGAWRSEDNNEEHIRVIVRGNRFRGPLGPSLGPRGGPAGLLRISGSLLGPLGGLLGASEDLLGASWSLLGASCDPLQALWGACRALWGPSSRTFI